MKEKKMKKMAIIWDWVIVRIGLVLRAGND